MSDYFPATGSLIRDYIKENAEKFLCDSDLELEDEEICRPKQRALHQCTPVVHILAQHTTATVVS